MSLKCLALSLAFALPSCHALAAVDCGKQPELVPSNSTEKFKADAAGKAQLLSKFLPEAEVKGNVEAWRTEQHQNYTNIDRQQKDLYFQWVSCQNIMSSRTLSDEQKQDRWSRVLAAFQEQIIYKTCSRPEFGRVGWQQNTVIDQSSGWVGPGSNPDNWCNDLINRTVQGRGIGPNHEAQVLGKNEEAKWGNRTFHTDRKYNYHCKIEIRWDPIFQSKADPACGVEFVR